MLKPAEPNFDSEADLKRFCADHEAACAGTGNWGEHDAAPSRELYDAAQRKLSEFAKAAERAQVLAKATEIAALKAQLATLQPKEKKTDAQTN